MQPVSLHGQYIIVRAFEAAQGAALHGKFLDHHQLFAEVLRSAMSGFEPAGLALAILPLIVSAAKHYEDCFRPFSRYKKFAKEAECFRTLLNVQKTIFRNQCSILLEEIADHDAALGILNGASHPSQSDQELERRLGELLGESKELCAAIIKTIQEKLSDVESESQQLGFDIEQERQVSFSTMIFAAFLHHQLNYQRKIHNQ